MNVECPYCKKVIEYCEHMGPDEFVRADERRKTLLEVIELEKRETQRVRDTYQVGEVLQEHDEYWIFALDNFADKLRKMAGDL